MIIINAIFNINENNLFLLIIIYIINILRIISIIYYFIKFEFIDVFLFINNCIKNIFFYNNCRELAIMLNNFAAKLIVVIIKKRTNLLILNKN